MSELRAWLRERLSLARFGPAALFLVLIGGAPDFSRVPSVGLALLLIAVFRLRDDLADRRRDAIEHPERVLVQARSTRPFAIAVVVGLALASVGVAVEHGFERALAVLGLAAAFELGHRVELPARHHWVLLKYPIFALLLADSLAPTLAGLCYLAFVVYERIDDRRLRARADANLRLAGYLFAAALLAGAHLLRGSASFGWLIAFGGVWAFAVEAARGQSPAGRFGLFWLCLLAWAHDQFAPLRGWP